MDAIIEQSSDTRITRIVDEITNTLERGELRPRPFSNVPHDATKEQLRTFAAAEVGRSIERVRMKLPSEPSDADARQAIKALEPFANAPMIREAIYWLRMYKQERPPCADADKWRCASEAFYLMDTLSSERPTDYLDGPFFSLQRSSMKRSRETPTPACSVSASSSSPRGTNSDWVRLTNLKRIYLLDLFALLYTKEQTNAGHLAEEVARNSSGRIVVGEALTEIELRLRHCPQLGSIWSRWSSRSGTRRDWVDAPQD